MNDIKQILRIISIFIVWIFLWFIIWKTLKHLELKRERNLSVKKSREVILWEVYEKISPMLADFPYNHKDLIFVWKWTDYIVFDWLSNWNLKQIIFLEVKSGKSALNWNEKEIKRVIEEKKIKYEVFRI